MQNGYLAKGSTPALHLTTVTTRKTAGRGGLVLSPEAREAREASAR
jgi:hypothetical protein